MLYTKLGSYCITHTQTHSNVETDTTSSRSWLSVQLFAVCIKLSSVHLNVVRSNRDKLSDNCCTPSRSQLSVTELQEKHVRKLIGQWILSVAETPDVLRQLTYCHIIKIIYKTWERRHKEVKCRQKERERELKLLGASVVARIELTVVIKSIGNGSSTVAVVW